MPTTVKRLYAKISTNSKNMLFYRKKKRILPERKGFYETMS